MIVSCVLPFDSPLLMILMFIFKRYFKSQSFLLKNVMTVLVSWKYISFH